MISFTTAASDLSYSKDSAHLFSHTGMKQLDNCPCLLYLSEGEVKVKPDVGAECRAGYGTSLSLMIYNIYHILLHFLFSRYIVAIVFTCCEDAPQVLG